MRMRVATKSVRGLSPVAHKSIAWKKAPTRRTRVVMKSNRPGNDILKDAHLLLVCVHAGGDGDQVMQLAQVF